MSHVKSRSITDSDKFQKRESIKQAAIELFLRQREIPSASSLAKESGIGKGTIYLYFSSKEEIYLDILEREFLRWFSAVLERLATKSRWTFDEFAAVVLAPLCGHRFFQDLAKYCPAVIEANVPLERLRQYREQLAKGLADIAAQFSRSFVVDGVGGDAEQTLIQSYAIISGVWTESQGGACPSRPMLDREFPSLELRFERDAPVMLVAFWRGKGWMERPLGSIQ